MKSEIIDRILSENRESLQKIIETARNNDVFQDIMILYFHLIFYL